MFTVGRLIRLLTQECEIVIVSRMYRIKFVLKE